MPNESTKSFAEIKRCLTQEGISSKLVVSRGGDCRVIRALVFLDRHSSLRSFTAVTSFSVLIWISLVGLSARMAHPALPVHSAPTDVKASMIASPDPP